MKLDEKSMRFLEEQIPMLAELAIKQAYLNALATGSSVLEAQNGMLVEVFPDGSQKTIRSLEPPIPVTLGKKIKIR